uniref:Uncharacterized protein n=1 Tax=Arion vulgaris TaxID=1028688 RepID=A0A0B6ZUV8_9EUPU
MANTCRQYLHEALKACEPFRFIKQKSPNVLLVDYPEDNSHDVTSVFHAVYHQNVRNVISHMSRECYVKVDAAVHVPDTNTSLFFVGSKILVYNLIKKAQVDSKFVPELSKSNVDTAFIVPNTSKIRILSGCESWDIDALSLELMVSERMQKSPCVHIDAAVVWQSKQYTFKECHVTIEGQEPIPLAEWGLPCHIDAVLHNEGNLIIFKGNNFWKYTGQGYSIQEGRTLDWTIDAVRCLP